jgi:universal stress protein E
MSQYKRIVVGMDLNSAGDALTLGAREAGKQAIAFARSSGGSIKFLHSTRPDETITALKGSPGITHEGLSDTGREAFDGILKAANSAGIEAELILTTGRPWLDITQLALRGDVDLVVVGKRNEAPTDGRRIGSVANKLLRKCPCPVWVVRPEQLDPSEVILAATDLTPTGDLIVRSAGELSTLLGHTLHVVHAWQMPFELPEERGKLKEAVLTQVQGVLDQAGLENAKVHTAQGKPSDIIDEAASHLKPDLLVMGTLSQTGVAGLLMGSTAERMLGRLDCSIFALKPDGFESPVKL